MFKLWNHYQTRLKCIDFLLRGFRQEWENNGLGHNNVSIEGRLLETGTGRRIRQYG
jgi:hypothetical protein